MGSIARVTPYSLLVVTLTRTSLYYATDASLRRAIKEFDENMTVITVSQRTSSIRHADKILVLDNGRAVGLGTHSELLESCEVYREIHNSQYGRGEAEI